MLIAVNLPAPLGPRRPKHSLERMPSVRLRTATLSPRLRCSQRARYTLRSEYDSSSSSSELDSAVDPTVVECGTRPAELAEPIATLPPRPATNSWISKRSLETSESFLLLVDVGVAQRRL